MVAVVSLVGTRNNDSRPWSTPLPIVLWLRACVRRICVPSTIDCSSIDDIAFERKLEAPPTCPTQLLIPMISSLSEPSEIVAWVTIPDSEFLVWVVSYFPRQLFVFCDNADRRWDFSHRSTFTTTWLRMLLDVISRSLRLWHNCFDEMMLVDCWPC